MATDFDREALDLRAVRRLADVLWHRGPETWAQFQDAIAGFLVGHGLDRCQYYLDSATTIGHYARDMGMDPELTAEMQRLYRLLGSLD